MICVSVVCCGVVCYSLWYWLILSSHSFTSACSLVLFCSTSSLRLLSLSASPSNTAYASTLLFRLLNSASFTYNPIHLNILSQYQYDITSSILTEPKQSFAPLAIQHKQKNESSIKGKSRQPCQANL